MWYFRISLGRDENKCGKWSLLLISWCTPFSSCLITIWRCRCYFPHLFLSCPSEILKYVSNKWSVFYEFLVVDVTLHHQCYNRIVFIATICKVSIIRYFIQHSYNKERSQIPCMQLAYICFLLNTLHTAIGSTIHTK